MDAGAMTSSVDISRRSASHRLRPLVIDLASVALACAAVALAAFAVAGDLHLVRVLSASMQPALAPGDIAIVRPIPALAVRSGAVVMVRDATTGSTYLHRAVSTSSDGAAAVITTRGDANPAPDPSPVRTASPVYVLVLRVPLGVVGASLATIPAGWIAVAAALLTLELAASVHARWASKRRAFSPVPIAVAASRERRSAEHHLGASVRRTHPVGGATVRTGPVVRGNGRGGSTPPPRRPPSPSGPSRTGGRPRRRGPA